MEGGLLEEDKDVGVQEKFIGVCQCLYQDVEASIVIDCQQ